MEKHYFVPVINRVYTNRNDRQYHCTGVVESSRPWETVAYFTRLSDGWSLAAHGPQIYEDGTIEWNYSTGGHWPQGKGGKYCDPRNYTCIQRLPGSH